LLNPEQGEYTSNMNIDIINTIIKQALQEDIGRQDITTCNLVPADQQSRGILVAKASGIIAGTEICQAVFRHLDPGVQSQIFVADGQMVENGDVIAEFSGKTTALLGGERVALNLLQRLSGIATRTRKMSDKIKNYKAQIVDTRKTTPGLRELEKYAVRVGGGRNHRFGLYDGVMIKDNHIVAGGGILNAVQTLRQRVPITVKIEVEVENLEQLDLALQAGADIIMLDNMDTLTMQKAVELVAGRALIEASGGITEDRLEEIARTGVDFISVGALTHSVQSLDISFDLVEVY